MLHANFEKQCCLCGVQYHTPARQYYSRQLNYFIGKRQCSLPVMEY